MSFKKNTTEMYKKTTLDKKHKEQIKQFDQNKNKINELKENLNKMNERMKEINNIDYINYSNQIISEKANLTDNINKITKQIKKIENNTD